MKTKINNTSPIYMTLQQLAKDPSFCFSIHMWRWYIFNADENGLAPAIRRVGRKIVLRRDLVIEWIESFGTKK